MRHSTGNFSRRDFLKSGAAGAVAASVLTPRNTFSEPKKPGARDILNYDPEMEYRPVGDTGVYLSVISMGGLQLSESVHHYAIERGVNFVHMSKSYKGGRSIEILSKVMKTKRDKVYIAFKDNFDDIDEVLRMLHTDHIDFLMFNRHKQKDVTRPDIFERFEKYKKAGKVRFMGLTTHRDVKNCVRAAIEDGRYQLIMPVLNQPNLELMAEELRLAHEKGIGIMAMKTMKGVKKTKLQMAYLKKVLQNPAVTTVNKGIDSFEDFDRYYNTMHEALTSREDMSLYRYAQANRSDNCMMCSECEKVCPHGIEISTILRSKDYYYEQVGDRDLAIETLRALPGRRITVPDCRDCRRCEEICPNGIRIVERLEQTERQFASYLA